jgi:lipopolysaccharide/colanic/teichoic acid biosynthesis glycosyltransferase
MVKKMSVPNTIDTSALESANNLNISDSSYIISKRLFDIALILFFAPIIIPIMLLTAILIKLEEPKASIFFWQKRVGAQGKAFNMIKFRSMTTDSEQHGSQFAQAGDKRVTRLGRFTRKMRIDELPQLWNIIRGEMSLIGPRPEQVVFVEEFSKTIPNYGDRHHVLPGITGLAQVKQGYVDDANGTRTKLAYDLYYIENISFLMDIRIALQTLHTMATGFGAR